MDTLDSIVLSIVDRQDKREIVDIIETWMINRMLIIKEFTISDMRNFIETMNAITRKYVRWFGHERDPEYYLMLNTLGDNVHSMMLADKRLDGAAVTRSRMLVNALEQNVPQFWTAWFELAVNASTLVTKGARIIADGIDRTNL